MKQQTLFKSLLANLEATKMTNTTKLSAKALLAGGLLSLASTSFAFESNSTGADGAFSPQVNTTVQLPEDGVFNYTTVNIPSGVVVDFERNTTNTPVIILASGDVTIAGTLTVNGTNGANVGPNGDGNLGDDALPGIGGPGGFDGGAGGTPESQAGGNGLGPGGASGAIAINDFSSPGNFGCGGAGAGHSVSGTWSFTRFVCDDVGVGGAYGSDELQPLLGGSGGGGGYASTSFSGGGGGGGGGAILIASSGTVTISGALTANGGFGGGSAGVNSGGTGGSGSGGVVRIIATTIAGNGTLTADGPGGVFHDIRLGGNSERSGNASDGRVRLEAENITRYRLPL